MQKIISFILYNIAQFVGYLDDLLTKQAYTPRDSTLEGFQGLTPSDNADSIKYYEEEIKKSLDSKYIKNIAISGAYGAGKSSILRTFEKKYPRYKYINISLASFNVKKDLTPAEEKELEAKIEKSIMQQIFYKVESSKLPFSKFARIKNTHRSTALVKVLLFFFWLLSGYLIYKGFNFPNIPFVTTTSDEKDYFKLFITVFFGFFSVVILYVLSRAASNSILNKLTFKGAEIEVPGSSKLNKFLDEFLYFFEVTPYQVVVFEDLDRHGNDSIFTKLRELNELINNADQIKRDIPVKFVYAIKDEMFTGTERTKFFDYIIPIVPVVTPANIGDVLWAALVEKETEEDFYVSKLFIYSIAIYIEDMRMLKNISYEFLVYKSCAKIKDTKEELEKLFSLIVYKNCFPEDFAKLHRNEGLLAGLFANKQKLISNQKDKTLKLIEEKKELIEQFKREHLKNIKELQYLYIAALVKQCPTCYNVNLNGKLTTIDQLLTEDNFRIFSALAATPLAPRNLQNSFIAPDITFGGLENDVGNYSERLELLNKEKQGGKEALQEEIEALKNEVAELSIMKLSSLIDDDFIKLDKLKDLNEQEKDLIIFLLRNAYIDENYQAYISYFYAGSLTQLDHEFIKNVQNQRKSDENMALENCEEVFSRLSILDIKGYCAFNLNLLSYVLKLDESDKKDAYLSSVCAENEASISFVAKFIASDSPNIIKLLNVLFKRQPSAWSSLAKELGDSGQQKANMLELMIKHVEIDIIIRAVKADKGLVSFISDYFTVLALLYSIEEKKVSKLIKELKIKFEMLESLNEHVEFSLFVYEGSFYKISYQNLETLVKAYAPNVNPSELSDAPLTILLASECEPIKKYVLDNLGVYINKVLLTQTSAPQESEDTVLMLINSEEVSEEMKEKVLVKINKSVSNILDVMDKEFWDTLLKNNAVKASWENIYQYFLEFWKEETELSSSLINFLNNESNYTKLSLRKVTKEDFEDEDHGESLLIRVYLCNDLNDEAYEVLLKSTDLALPKLFFEGLSEEKVRMLIDTKHLVLTQENLIYMENHYEGLCLEFIGQNIEEYLSDPDLYDLDSKELVELYNMGDIEDLQKVKLTSLVEEVDLVAEDDLIKQVVSCLIRVSDVSNVNLKILTPLIVLHQNLNEKKTLLAKVIPLMKKVDVKECLVNLDKKYEDIFNRRKPKFDVNDENTELLKALESKGLISQFVLVGKKYRIEPKRDPLS